MQRDLSLASPCEQTIAMLISTMASHDIRLERSFDLRSALNDQPDCPCPQHGTTQCTCQYVVLLAYEPATLAPPVVIAAHECDGGRLSWLLLAVLDETLTSAAAEVRRDTRGCAEPAGGGVGIGVCDDAQSADRRPFPASDLKMVPTLDSWGVPCRRGAERLQRPGLFPAKWPT